VLHILIADDHGIVRAGLRMLLDRQEGMSVIAEAQDGVEAVEMAIGHKPDIAILDVAMPRMTGLQAARHIREQAPDVHVLLL
jgi:YesN/AraC family two-component response regulator